MAIGLVPHLDEEMKAIILAAGRGKRLKPLTDRIAKPLLPVNGKPIIERIIENLSFSGINEFNIVVGYLGEQIKFYLRERFPNLEISYSIQDKQLGTAHALQKTELPDSDFLVSASDSLFPLEYLKKFLKFHSMGEITLALKRMSEEEILSSSTVKLDGNIVRRIIEKPSMDEILSLIACAPLYIFPPEIRDYLKGMKKSKRGEYEIAQVIQRMIDDGFIARGIIAKEWIHMSDIDDFLRLNFPYLFNKLPYIYPNRA